MKRAGRSESIQAKRLESAAAWLVRLEAVGETQLTPEEVQAWDDWAADEDNRAAFDELAALLQRTRAVPVVRRPTRAELFADEVSDVDAGSPAGTEVAPKNVWFPAIAASVVLVMAALTALRLLHSLRGGVTDVLTATYSTRTGEQRRLELPDGSVITMGGASELRLAYTAQQRNVTLDNGEAFFHVAHDTSRPFRVHAENGVITAVGTRFNVLRASDGVTVTVTEGTVEVAPAPVLPAAHAQNPAQLAMPRWLAVRVTHGEEMTYQPRGEATAVELVDPKIAAAWSRGTLVYDRRPLAEVIDDVTRYWGHQVTLGPGTGELLYSGTVGERHIGAWIRALPNIFPVTVTPTESGGVSIQLRQH